MTEITLTNHALAHMGALKVDPSIFETRFASGCAMTNCIGACCRGGVWADIAERDRILKHAATIKEFMDPDQDHDDSKWFDAEVIDDADFPSAKAVGTQVRHNGCVFLDGAGRCVLQKVDIAKGNTVHLKPFYCTAFPITIEAGSLTYDDYMADEQPRCCSARLQGDLTVFDVCAYELEFTVGPEAAETLRELSPP